MVEAQLYTLPGAAIRSNGEQVKKRAALTVIDPHVRRQ